MPGGEDLEAPKAIDLSREPEIFILLRNGLVTGSVYCRATGTVLPLVNISSIFPRS